LTTADAPPQPNHVHYNEAGMSAASQFQGESGAPSGSSAATTTFAGDATVPRPFRILGVQQIAVGSTSKARLRRLWLDCLGLAVEGHYVSERENVDEDIAIAGHGPSRCEVDLMQPLDAARKPAVHEPALNHIGLWVDDLAQAVAWLSAQGVRFAPGGIRKGAAGHDITFIHPKGNDEYPIGGEGVLIELVQAPPEIVASHSR
jgi:lactoylglutathione lyase